MPGRGAAWGPSGGPEVDALTWPVAPSWEGKVECLHSRPRPAQLPDPIVSRSRLLATGLTAPDANLTPPLARRGPPWSPWHWHVSCRPGHGPDTLPSLQYTHYRNGQICTEKQV